jgi:hypothetical protein
VNEKRWLACKDPDKMLKFLKELASDRKLRLFACACFTGVFAQSDSIAARAAIEVSERYADGRATLEELDRVRRVAQDEVASYIDDFGQPGSVYALSFPASLARAVSLPPSEDFASRVSSRAIDVAWRRKLRVRKTLCVLLREIFGNPFRPITLDPIWLTPTVASLAQTAYEVRPDPSGHLDPTRLAVLADALEDAGCTEAAILDHLRGPGPHVRGCFVLDLLLGKS